MKICQIHDKKFSEKSPNKQGNYWHVIDYDAGKFCSFTKAEYDALPSESEEENYDPRPAQLAKQTRELVNQTDQNIWDAKDRTSMYQTCLKSASEVIAALVQVGIVDSVQKAEEDIKIMAHNFYLEMQSHREDNEKLPF